MPPGWKASAAKFMVTIVSAGVTQQTGSHPVLDPHGVLFRLQPWDGPPLTEGQIVTVGQEHYPGRLETPTTQATSGGAASAVRIEYAVGDYTWDIEGEFGSAVGQDSHERAMFTAIVQSIHHEQLANKIGEPTISPKATSLAAHAIPNMTVEGILDVLGTDYRCTSKTEPSVHTPFIGVIDCEDFIHLAGIDNLPRSRVSVDFYGTSPKSASFISIAFVWVGDNPRSDEAMNQALAVLHSVLTTGFDAASLSHIMPWISQNEATGGEQTLSGIPFDIVELNTPAGNPILSLGWFPPHGD